jgi:hypothetical protein
VGEAPGEDGLRAGDVHALAAASTIGFHTRRHDALPDLPEPELERALADGRDELATAAAAPVDVIAYPHGKGDRRVAAAAKEAGFRAGFTTGRGIVRPGTDPFLIPRTVTDLTATGLALRLARLFRTAGEVSSAAPHSSADRTERRAVPGDVDTVVQENDQLRKEVRRLEERVRALESSRWWKLHPRYAVGRLRGATAQETTPSAATIGAPSLPIDFDEHDSELWQRVRPYTMTTPPRVYALVRAVEYVAERPIPGALVECGVWRGGSMMAIALTLLRLGVTERDLYLFDTFTGMTEPTEEDVRHTGGSAAEILASESKDSHHWAIAPLDQVKEAVLGVGYPEERIHFVQGPVEETLPANAPDEIALLRLDTDWYGSTKHELVHLYPRLHEGGPLIIDDYAYWEGARRAVDEYVREQDLPLLLNRIDHTARIAIKP